MAFSQRARIHSVARDVHFTAAGAFVHGMYRNARLSYESSAIPSCTQRVVRGEALLEAGLSANECVLRLELWAQ